MNCFIVKKPLSIKFSEFPGKIIISLNRKSGGCDRNFEQTPYFRRNKESRLEITEIYRFENGFK